MKVFKLIFKNALRHKLRTTLTIFGIAIAVIAFGLLRTVVTIWDSSVDAAGADRLITRQAVSFIFPLPVAYKTKIEAVPGVESVCGAVWFGGTYKDKSNFFARVAMDDNFFELYPEFIVSEEDFNRYKNERNGCIVGKSIADQYNFKVGDIIVLDGDIFPGRWEFVVSGIYLPQNKNTDGTQMLFHYDYLNETIKQNTPGRGDQIFWYIIKIEDIKNSAEISEQIDALFKNSTAETKTETEKAFAQSFVSASGAIITAMNFMSFAIIGIIMLVLANTMVMSARERTREYAVFKTLGFSAIHLTGLILGESMLIACIGGGIGISLLYPIVSGFEQVMPKGFFPFFFIEPITIILAVSSALLIGILAAVFPIHKALNTKIVDGFRFVG
ncbi:MAG: ABC transporter ATP-binding protein [Ignavibacteriae bacterium HGW-Ignavibacteriae-3]|nr:MAG: ABC transporter ATP-binding protein [Ignavibacteriae bacterium HGW-Ignavibacteriae-3]